MYSAVGSSSRSFWSANSRGMSSSGGTGSCFRDLQAGPTAAIRTRASRTDARISGLLSGFRPADLVALLDGRVLLDLGGAVGVVVVRFRDLQNLRPRHLFPITENEDLLAGLERETGIQLHEDAVGLADQLHFA